MGHEIDAVVEELRKVKRLLSVLVTRGLKQRDQIEALSRVGFSPKEIAGLIGTTPNTVSVTLAQIRKKSPRSAKAPNREVADDE